MSEGTWYEFTRYINVSSLGKTKKVKYGQFVENVPDTNIYRFYIPNFKCNIGLEFHVHGWMIKREAYLYEEFNGASSVYYNSYSNLPYCYSSLLYCLFRDGFH